MIKILQPPASFVTRSTVNLGGEDYRLRLRYDERLGSWYADAWQAPSGDPVVLGWRLVDGEPVGKPGNGWPGELSAFPVARGATLENSGDLMAGRAVAAYFEARPEESTRPAGYRVLWPSMDV